MYSNRETYEDVINAFKQFLYDQDWKVIYEDPLGVISIRTKKDSWDFSFFAPGESLSGRILEELAGAKEATSWLVLASKNELIKANSDGCYELFELNDPTFFDKLIETLG